MNPARTTAPIIPLGLLATIAPLVQAYSNPAVVPLLALAALAICLLDWRQVLRWQGRQAKWLIAWFGATVAVGFASALWAVDPRLASGTALRILGIFLSCTILLSASLSLDDEGKRRFGTFLLAGFVVALANLELSMATGGWVRSWFQEVFQPIVGRQRPVVMPTSFDTAMTLTSLLVWPSLVVAWRRFGWLPAVALYIAGLLVVRQGGSLTALIAYCGGAAVFVVARLMPSATALCSSVGLALWIFLAPVLLQPGLTGGLGQSVTFNPSKESSFQHRRAIWGFVIERIKERPALGWGLGNSRVIPGGHTEIAPGVELLPLHPHDAALQLWLEMGVPGAVLGASFLFLLASGIRRTVADPNEYALAVALLATAVVNGMSSYNLWHEWWMTFLAMVACFFAAAASRRPQGVVRTALAPEPQSPRDPAQKAELGTGV